MTLPSHDEPSSTDKKINVMLVDDSSVIRASLARILENESSIKIVSSVSNGQMAVTSAQIHKPDIVILDIEMPIMNGLEALPKILEVSPDSKVIMFSTLTEKGADVSLKALGLGAVECFAKPSSADNIGKGSDFEKTLIATIKNLVSPGKALSVKADTTSKKGPTPYSLIDDSRAYKGKPSIVVIGSSTGGPQALFEVIKHLKNIDIPIVITQHMPATFTKILAQHITQNTEVSAQEGEEGMLIKPGAAYVAPGGKHMHLVKGDDGSTKIRLNDDPPINFCKPSVDPMFMTAVELYGEKILGIMLTGMGHDGLDGTRALTEAGGRLVAQDEASSVVWGMPGAVATAGLCSAVLPLTEIGPWVKNAVKG